jgi:multicomponent Na+:H+ antiporter subunit G
MTGSGAEVAGVAAWIGVVLLVLGCAFYGAGTVGLLRFPDVYSRLHALTKADNQGLLLVCAGLAVLSGSARAAFVLAVIWLLGLLAASVSAHLIARHARVAERQAVDTERP